MLLKLVTYEGDLTQFLVDAETDEKAIEIAIKANRALDEELKEIDEDAFEVLGDSSVYQCEDVDWKLIKVIFDRDDKNGEVEDTIVFGY